MSMTVQWFPLLPVWLVLLIGAALLGVLAFGSSLLTRRKSVPRPWVIALGALRVGMIIVFILGLLRPVLSMPRSVALAPDVLVLVDTSQSMNQPSATRSGNRLDEVRGVLRTSPAVRKAARTHNLHWFAFDKKACATTVEALEKSEPRGEATDFAASLKSAVEQIRLKSATAGLTTAATRVLVASDGQDQGAADAAAVARELGVAVDVLAPAPGDRKGRPAATIADVQGARRVLLGSETALLATVRADGAADGLALVLQDDGREIQRRDLGALPVGQEARVEFSDHPAAPGLKRYMLRLVQGDAPVGAGRAVNVQVSDRRHEVLMLEDTWRWDFKFLRRLLEDDPSFSFTAFLARGGAAFVQFGEPDRRVQLGGFPHSRRELDGFDTLILGDVNPQGWPRGLARHVYDAVVEGGKSLVVIAGPHLAEWTNTIELMRLLPVELTRQSGMPVTGLIDLRVTPEGMVSSWFSLLPQTAEGDDPAQAAATAAPARVSPVEQLYPVLRKRPAATVLLEAAGQSNAYGPLIVVAEHTVGRGRVLFIGTDTLWRWQTMGPRTESGVTLYHTFWQHALRALAPPEPASATNQLWLHPERTLYHAGDRVRVSTERHPAGSDAAANAPATASVTASVVLPDGSRLPLDLVPDPREPRHLSAKFDVTQPGRYRIEASARSDVQLVSETASFIEVLPRPGEGDDAPVELGLLARLASATGGRMIDPTAPDGWLPTEPAASPTIIQRESLDLWHNFSLLLVLCLLLASDWSLRLFRGLV